MYDIEKPELTFNERYKRIQNIKEIEKEIFQ